MLEVQSAVPSHVHSRPPAGIAIHLLHLRDSIETLHGCRQNNVMQYKQHISTTLEVFQTVKFATSILQNPSCLPRQGCCTHVASQLDMLMASPERLIRLYKLDPLCNMHVHKAKHGSAYQAVSQQHPTEKAHVGFLLNASLASAAWL